MARYEITLTDGTVEVAESGGDWRRNSSITWLPTPHDVDQPVRCWSGRPALFTHNAVVIIRSQETTSPV
jgi:hypothetical protein